MTLINEFGISLPKCKHFELKTVHFDIAQTQVIQTLISKSVTSNLVNTLSLLKCSKRNAHF